MCWLHSLGSSKSIWLGREEIIGFSRKWLFQGAKNLVFKGLNWIIFNSFYFYFLSFTFWRSFIHLVGSMEESALWRSLLTVPNKTEKKRREITNSIFICDFLVLQSNFSLLLFVFGNSIHLEVASDSFCFLINSSWLLVFILYVFSFIFCGFNLYCWKGIHFS